MRSECIPWCTACIAHCTEALGGLSSLGTCLTESRSRGRGRDRGRGRGRGRGSGLGTCLTESSVAASAQARECILPGRG